MLRHDGWQSMLTGLGTPGYDKRLHTHFTPHELSWDYAMALWRGDDLAARIVETLPSEMLRQGYEISLDDDEGHERTEAVMARLEELGVEQVLWRALCYERAYGGAAIMLGADDGATDLTQPLQLERVRSLSWLTSLEPRDLSPVAWYDDPMAPRFGEPSVYQLTMPGTGAKSLASVRVHESRLIVFPGIQVSQRRYTSSNNGWGESALARVVSVLRDFNAAYTAAGILVHDFAQAVFKIKNLAELVAADKADVLSGRMRAVEMSRSVARAILIDAEGEEFERKQTPVSGLPELLDRLNTRLAAAADMPLTLLMGQSPGGLNATGESDVRFFYDRVKATQQRKLGPAIRRIAQLVMLADGGEPASWSVKFAPLWQPTEKEQADTRLVQAQVDTAYIQAGVVSPEEIAVSRFGGDGYSTATKIDFAAREAMEVAAPAPVSETSLAPAPTGGGAGGAGEESATETTPTGPVPADPADRDELPPTVFNGAQIASLVDIVRAVAAGELGRESAMAIIETTFPVTSEQAAQILGDTQPGQSGGGSGREGGESPAAAEEATDDPDPLGGVHREDSPYDERASDGRFGRVPGDHRRAGP